MDENIEAFRTFRHSLNNKTIHANGDVSFNGEVVYSSNVCSEEEILNITLHFTTIEFGKIKIDDGEVLNSEIVHMDFSHKFQEYAYDKDGFLIIEGSSEKVGGNYTVKISEV